MALKLKTYQYGSPRKRGEGLRIGTARFLPRGVKKKDYARFDLLDIWLPSIAPSRKLLQTFKQKKKRNNGSVDHNIWNWYISRYEKEMGRTEASQTIKLIAKISKKTNVSIGCYCGDEKYCHRSILKKLIKITK